MKKNFKNKKGITLIALVITLIVLLILAGISISMISSQDGILNKATSAKEKTKIAADKEAVNLAIQAATINEDGTLDIEELKTEFKKLDLTIIEKDKSYVGYYADVDGDGTVDGIIYGDKAIGTEGTRKWKME